MNVDDDTVLKLRTEDLSWTPADDGEVMVLDHRRSLYLAISASGAPLWDALASGATRAGLVEALVVAWGLDDASAGSDVDDFLALLHSRDLVETAR